MKMLFNTYGGMPEEIVYDQDHLITVSENAGDIILTGEFQAYKNNEDLGSTYVERQILKRKAKLKM